MRFTPIYNQFTYRELEYDIDTLYHRLERCDICPFNCYINRLEGKKGRCSETKLKVASYNIHRGEEPPISAYGGSGTIFLSGCHFHCIFCQNFPISQYNNGNIISEEKMAAVILKLQDEGVHNINFVTPTHFAPMILKSILIAREKGFILPVAYNNSGYEKIDVLKIVSKLCDIFLFDMKYSDNELAFTLSNVYGYKEINVAVFKYLHSVYKNRCIIYRRKMHGTIYNIMNRGIIIRHLIIPNESQNSKEVLDAIAKVTKRYHLALMNQYFPAYRAASYEKYNKTLEAKEYDEIIGYAVKKGFKKLFTQE